jgi:hypothetical protein
MMQTNDIHWVAGFLEGEGCFSCSIRSPKIEASQKQIEPLEKLKRIYGRKIKSYRKRNINNWTIYGTKAIELMMTLFVLMSTNRRNAIRKVISIWRTTSIYNRDKKFCKHGHSFSVSNTYFTSRGHRRCMACRRLVSSKKYYRQKKMENIQQIRLFREE